MFLELPGREVQCNNVNQAYQFVFAKECRRLESTSFTSIHGEGTKIKKGKPRHS